MKNNIGVMIGRFQPIHEGHVHALSIAASQVKTLYILVGSANVARSIKNPWTFTERKHMIDTKLRSNQVTNFVILPVNDYPYSDAQWIADIQYTIDQVKNDDNVILFGHMKEGNDYLNWFPRFTFRDIEALHNINATTVRENMFKNNDPAMPLDVKADWDFYQKEKQLFKDYPFKETLNFNCADAVVVCAGHVLLIKRKVAPGRNTWALPGGFKNAKETFLDCAIRELFEETNLRVPEKVVRGSICKTELFDSPNRSFGIPRNTLAVYIQIAPNQDNSLPRANPADDAVECKWVTLSDAINKFNLFEDHAAIISKLTGSVPVSQILLNKGLL